MAHDVTDDRRMEKLARQNGHLGDVVERVFRSMMPDEEWDSEHLEATPDRFIEMIRQLTTKPEIKWKDFASESDEMVIVRDITFHSLCAHHMLPFIGKAHIGYVPDSRVCGLSKLARVVRHCAAGLTVQEELTTDIANTIEKCFAQSVREVKGFEPANATYIKGVAVVLEAEHLCMTLRGVQAPGATTVTSCMRGVFSDHDRLARAEFLNLVRRSDA